MNPRHLAWSSRQILVAHPRSSKEVPMLNQKTLLTLSFALCFSLAAGLAQAQSYCPVVVGMSACEPAYPGVWAQCGYDAYLVDCLASDPDDLECWAIAGHIWASEFNSASRDCSAIETECQLMGGFRNAYGGCSRYFAGGGGGSTGFATGGGGGGFSCAECNCTGEHSSYSGDVCGWSAAALISACWSSCS
jgi:hypothetical protein